jgi:hypothetical protein
MQKTKNKASSSFAHELAHLAPLEYISQFFLLMYHLAKKKRFIKFVFKKYLSFLLTLISIVESENNREGLGEVTNLNSNSSLWLFCERVASSTFNCADTRSVAINTARSDEYTATELTASPLSIQSIAVSNSPRRGYHRNLIMASSKIIVADQVCV